MGQFAGRSKTGECKSEIEKVAWVSLFYHSNLEVTFRIAFSLWLWEFLTVLWTPEGAPEQHPERASPLRGWASLCSLCPAGSGAADSKGSTVTESQIPTEHPSQRWAFQNQINQLCGKINQLYCIGRNGLKYVLSDITADKFCPPYLFFLPGEINSAQEILKMWSSRLLASHKLSSHFYFNKVI